MICDVDVSLSNIPRKNAGENQKEALPKRESYATRNLQMTPLVFQA